MPSKLLTFEIDSNAGSVEVHLNSEGAADLIGVLERLRASATNAHEHLKTEAWGGGKLTPVKQGGSATLVNHVKVFFWRE